MVLIIRALNRFIPRTFGMTPKDNPDMQHWIKLNKQLEKLAPDLQHAKRIKR